MASLILMSLSAVFGFGALFVAPLCCHKCGIIHSGFVYLAGNVTQTCCPNKICHLYVLLFPFSFICYIGDRRLYRLSVEQRYESTDAILSICKFRTLTQQSSQQNQFINIYFRTNLVGHLG